MSVKSIIVIAGVGNGTGTGAGTAKVFAKAGYRVALIARNADYLKKTETDLQATGAEAASFPIPAYNAETIASAFKSIRSHFGPAETAPLRVALWNAGHAVWKPFLQITDDDVSEALDTNVRAAFAFARNAILEFQKNELDAKGKRGTLLFTGATASWRGNVVTSAISASKFGLRALSQSLNKEFGKENIHVAHSIIDGLILTDRVKERVTDAEWQQNEDVRLNPESIGEAYLYLAGQDRSAWTWELDLRPAHEKW